VSEQIGGQFRQSLGFIVCPADLDRQILALNEASFLAALSKAGQVA
jgi:hypothetical protein